MVATTRTWSWANAVTVLRVVLVPLVVLALLAEFGGGGWRWVAAGLFALAAASDRLDGYLARRLDQVTDWGKLVDPIADKLLIGACLVVLSWLGEVSWWATVVIGIRELGITALRFAVLRYVVIPASRGGKLKTVLQSVGIGMLLAPLDAVPGWHVAGTAVLWTAVAVTVVTGVDYVRRGLAVRRAVT